MTSPSFRKGRFDELFAVDLPNQSEREAIWAIQIARYGRAPKDFDIAQLARATGGLTGSEVEQVFIEALFHGFDQETEPTDLAIAQVLVEFVPLSKLMAEQVSASRSWATGRAKPATTQQGERKLRRLAA
jgi:SpoVK/Ycf46/Vps4 family AAA+-type ATPase